MSHSTHPAARASKQIFSRLDWIGLGWIGFGRIGLALALFENERSASTRNVKYIPPVQLELNSFWGAVYRQDKGMAYSSGARATTKGVTLFSEQGFCTAETVETVGPGFSPGWGVDARLQTLNSDMHCFYGRCLLSHNFLFIYPLHPPAPYLSSHRHTFRKHRTNLG